MVPTQEPPTGPYIRLTPVDAPFGLIKEPDICLALRELREVVSPEVQHLIDLAESSQDPHILAERMDSYILQIPRNESPKKPKRGKKKTYRNKLKGNRSKRRAKEFAQYQHLFQQNPGQVAANLINGTDLEVNVTPSEEDIHKFFESTYSKTQVPWQPRPPAEQAVVNLRQPITRTELVAALRRMNESAAGPDGITRADLRAINQNDLLALINIIWGAHLLSPVLKLNRTALLPKSGDLTNPKNWRPITIASKLLRLLQQIVSQRLEKSIPLHFSQRGFTPQDGVLMNNTILQAVLKTYRAAGKPLTVLSLDLAKAFDRVTIESIVDALRKARVDEATIRYVQANYEDITTILQCHGIATSPIPLKRGTKQGDPMSGFLFNLIIDALLYLLHEYPGVDLNGTPVKAMAFADDIILFANSPDEMTEMISCAMAFFTHHRLDVNVEKCSALQLLRVPNTKRTCVFTKPLLKIDGHNVPTISVDEQFKYLGHKYAHYGVKTPTLSKLDAVLLRIKSAPLRPHQKLLILQRYLVPALYHGLQQTNITAGKLKTYNVKIRSFVKSVLHLPRTTPDICIHAPLRFGGLAIPDLKIQVAATLERRLAKISLCPDLDVQAALTTATVKTLKDRLSRITRALNGNSAQNVKNYYRAQIQGTALMKGFSAVRVPSQWIYAPPDFWRFGDYIRAVHLRFGLLPTTSTPWRQAECRNPSCAEQENLYHVTQRCPVTHFSRINRHDAINKQLVTAIKRKEYNVLDTPTIHGTAVDGDSSWAGQCFKPDNIVVTSNTAYVIDTTIAYESYEQSVNAAYAHKILKYNAPAFIQGVKKLTRAKEVKNLPFVLGARGTWHPENDRILAIFGLHPATRDQMATSVLQWGSTIHKIFNATVWRMSPPLHRKACKKKTT
ncbi:hypothetical protein FOCC_FOCC015401 [Frankliniella occidentalis]|nr:hypothetical protein FOCC_FOCC015401 [Frankliniella occidentalis]